MTESFECWAIVELMGRDIIAGKVSEQVIGGAPLLRIDVPAVDGQDAFTKFYSPGAVYCITPTDQGTAEAAAQGFRKKAIEIWKLNLPQLQVPSRMDVDEDIDDSEIDDYDPVGPDEDFDDGDYDD